jgi:hypothetical protein
MNSTSQVEESNVYWKEKVAKMIKERKHILKLIQTTHKEISLANSHNAALDKDLKEKNKLID